MSFSDDAYFQQMGEAAREKCVGAKIITHNQCKLTEAHLTKIVEYFHGKLCGPDQGGNETKKSLLRKAEENDTIKFFIEYSDFEVLDLLHELGHAFLELETMEPGEVRGCDDESGGVNELNASKFARAFVMPRKLFEKKVLEHSAAGVCNIQKVADAFGVDYWQVVTQGRQLQIW